MGSFLTSLTQPLLSAPLPCWVIGHRGAAAECPENTLASFLLARDTGACMIEVDVQQSTDGELFVFHDDTLERLCKEPVAVASLPWEALATKVVGHWDTYPLRIPRLTEVFSTLQRSVLYNVELKTDTVAYPGIEARLAETNAYAAGAEFSFADIPLGLSVHRWFGGDFTRPDLPNVAAYYQRVKSRPAAMPHFIAATP